MGFWASTAGPLSQRFPRCLFLLCKALRAKKSICGECPVQSSREGVALAELGVQGLCSCPLCDPPVPSLGFPICAIEFGPRR